MSSRTVLKRCRIGCESISCLVGEYSWVEAGGSEVEVASWTPLAKASSVLTGGWPSGSTSPSGTGAGAMELASSAGVSSSATNGMEGAIESMVNANDHNKRSMKGGSKAEARLKSGMQAAKPIT